MKPVRISLVLACTMIVWTQASWAVKAKHGPLSSSSTPPTVIERGGMVTSINAAKKTISVDGVAYPLSSIKGSAGLDQLKQGTMVKFSTSKDGAKGVDRVTQIQVATPPPPAKAAPIRRQ